MVRFLFMCFTDSVDTYAKSWKRKQRNGWWNQGTKSHSNQRSQDGKKEDISSG